MASLSASSWVILLIGIIIFFGGSIYTLLIAMGKKPDSYLEKLGVMEKMEAASEKGADLGIYKPFEYMDRGNTEKALGAFVVLVLLLFGWWAGFYEEDAEASSSKIFLVDISEETVTLAEESGYSDEGETIEYFYSFTQENLLSVRVTLSWTDDIPGLTGGDNDEFELQYHYDWLNDKPDEGTDGGSDSSTSGEIIWERETTIERPETNDSYQGRSVEAVKREFTVTETGEYWVNVTCTNAGNRDPTPFGQDGGNDFSMRFEISYYVVKVTEIPLPA